MPYRGHTGRGQAGTLTLQVLDDTVELPVPRHGCPQGSAKAEIAMRGARLALSWHPQTLCPKERVSSPPAPLQSCLLLREEGVGSGTPFPCPCPPTTWGRGYGEGKDAPSRTPLAVHVPYPKMPPGSSRMPRPVSAPISWGAAGARPPHPGVSLSLSLSPSPRIQDVGLVQGKRCLCFCSRFLRSQHEQCRGLPGREGGIGAHSPQHAAPKTELPPRQSPLAQHAACGTGMRFGGVVGVGWGAGGYSAAR